MRIEDILVPRTTVEGDRAQVNPVAGDTLELRETVPTKPFTDDTVTVDAPPTGPATTAIVDGLTETEKSCTVAVTVTVCVRDWLVPVIVSV